MILDLEGKRKEVDVERLLTIAQAAREAQLSADRIRQLVRQGRLEFVQTPYGRLVKAESLRRLLAERRKGDVCDADLRAQ